MTVVHYKATVRSDRLLELPPEAQRFMIPGQEIDIEFKDVPATPKPNEEMLGFLNLIESQHKDRPYTDGSDTLRLLKEARGGAMYGCEPTEQPAKRCCR